MNQGLASNRVKQQDLPPQRLDESIFPKVLRLPQVGFWRYSSERRPAEPVDFETRTII